MTTISLDEIPKLLHRIDVPLFSAHVLGEPYDQVKKILYPHPRYHTFLIGKKSGGVRIISEPSRKVKILQDKFLQYIYENSKKPKDCVHGFTHGRSIVTNAKSHISDKTRFVLNIDLEDFFPSITFYRVRGMFLKAPWNFSYEVATLAAHLCCYGGSLPQGASTSPAIANLICRRLDSELFELARRNRAVYSRYADDITFSFNVLSAERLPRNLCALEGAVATVGSQLQDCILGNGFKINVAKVRISNKYRRLEVTGLTINEFANVRREYVDRIRGALSAWKNYGYSAAEENWKKRSYLRQTRTDTIPPLKNYLHGKLLFLRMVRGKDDLLYTKLAEKYNKLVQQEIALDPAFTARNLPVFYPILKTQHFRMGTFVVECLSDNNCSQGTAFYLEEIGLITCNHVITEHETVHYKDGDEGEITIRDGQSNKTWFAKILFADKFRDLAILDFCKDQPDELRHFKISPTAVHGNERVHLLGFPNYSPGKSLSAVGSNVTSKYVTFSKKLFEIRDMIRSGNSGGPIINDEFHVIGVAMQGANQSSGNNEALSVEELGPWLDHFTKYR